MPRAQKAIISPAVAVAVAAAAPAYIQGALYAPSGVGIATATMTAATARRVSVGACRGFVPS